MRKTLWILNGILAGLTGFAAAPLLAADGDGLVANPESSTWSRWQGRVSFGATRPVWRSGLGGFESGGLSQSRAARVNSLSMMGDYFFGSSLASPGGFRATSGLIIGPRSQMSVGQPGLTSGSMFSVGSRLFGQSALPGGVDSPNDTATLPYLGLGYTGMASRDGWNFSADLGMVGLGSTNPSSQPFGASRRSLDDAVRDMRLTPIVQIGLLHSF